MTLLNLCTVHVRTAFHLPLKLFHLIEILDVLIRRLILSPFHTDI